MYSQRGKTKSQTGLHSTLDPKDRCLKTDDILGAAPKIHGGNESQDYAGVRGLGFLNKSHKTDSQVFAGLVDDTTSRQFLRGRFAKPMQYEQSSKATSEFSKTELTNNLRIAQDFNPEYNTRNQHPYRNIEDSLDREFSRQNGLYHTSSMPNLVPYNEAQARKEQEKREIAAEYGKL